MSGSEELGHLLPIGPHPLLETFALAAQPRPVPELEVSFSRLGVEWGARHIRLPSPKLSLALSYLKLTSVHLRVVGGEGLEGTNLAATSPLTLYLPRIITIAPALGGSQGVALGGQIMGPVGFTLEGK